MSSVIYGTSTLQHHLQNVWYCILCWISVFLVQPGPEEHAQTLYTFIGSSKQRIQSKYRQNRNHFTAKNITCLCARRFMQKDSNIVLYKLRTGIKVKDLHLCNSIVMLKIFTLSFSLSPWWINIGLQRHRIGVTAQKALCQSVPSFSSVYSSLGCVQCVSISLAALSTRCQSGCCIIGCFLVGQPVLPGVDSWRL